MEENNNGSDNVTPISPDQQQAISQIADQIKTGDDALNKLKVQNLDFILDIPL
jgi:flagellar motor switch protein FliN/FliY